MKKVLCISMWGPNQPFILATILQRHLSEFEVTCAHVWGSDNHPPVHTYAMQACKDLSLEIQDDPRGQSLADLSDRDQVAYAICLTGHIAAKVSSLVPYGTLIIVDPLPDHMRDPYCLSSYRECARFLDSIAPKIVEQIRGTQL